MICNLIRTLSDSLGGTSVVVTYDVPEAVKLADYLYIMGDGALRYGVEACDDGNADDADACPTTCLPAICGDGFIRAGVEACDDANTDDHDACRNDCRLATCGDGVVHAGAEACDDGNREAGDGCDPTCAEEPPDPPDPPDVGDAGGCSTGGDGGARGLVPALVILFALASRHRRRPRHARPPVERPATGAAGGDSRRVMTAGPWPVRPPTSSSRWSPTC